MNIDKILMAFQNQLVIWETELSKYTEEDLLVSPQDGAWTLGQVYQHLIQASIGFHIKQIETGMSNGINRKKGKNIKGFVAFKILKGFPPTKIKVPPSDSYTPVQPKNKEDLFKGLLETGKQMQNMAKLLKENNNKGKTVHPALGHLKPSEWFSLIEMHFRHHLTQKAEIDAVLN